MLRIVLCTFAILTGCAAALAEQKPLQETPGALGYPSVAAALQAVKADRNVKLSTQNGWTVGVDESSETFWSFPPPGHPAYPAAVRRRLIDKGDGIYITMAVACEAPKPACDKLVEQFKAVNASLRKNFETRR